MAVDAGPPRGAVTVHAAELRWGGATLALGALLFVLGVIFGLRAFGGEWDTTLGPTLPQTADVIRGKWSEFRVIWSGELIGALLLAVAAFLLQRRPHAPGWLPVALVWIVVGVGSLLVAVAYAVTLGSYPSALAAFDEQPALFAALRGATLSLHASGSVLQLLGLLSALAIEFRWRGTSLPDRLVQAGAGAALLGFAAATAGLVPGEFIAAGVFAAAVLLGIAIWLRAGILTDSVRGAHATHSAAWPIIVAVISLAVLAPAVRAQTAPVTLADVTVRDVDNQPLPPILDMHMHDTIRHALAPSATSSVYVIGNEPPGR